MHKWFILDAQLTTLYPNLLILKKVAQTNELTNGVSNGVPSRAASAAKNYAKTMWKVKTLAYLKDIMKYMPFKAQCVLMQVHLNI